MIVLGAGEFVGACLRRRLGVAALESRSGTIFGSGCRGTRGALEGDLLGGQGTPRLLSEVVRFDDLASGACSCQALPVSAWIGASLTRSAGGLCAGYYG